MIFQGCFHFCLKSWVNGPGPLEALLQFSKGNEFTLKIVGTLGTGLLEGPETTNKSYGPLSDIDFIVQLNKVLNLPF